MKKDPVTANTDMVDELKGFFSALITSNEKTNKYLNKINKGQE